ncbi:hypothetical protein [Aeromicrobium sp.]|uniref:hypothetical protein n=1 Tax=Aeromicrobium sp. TaxID=1871063 RepID=UPI0035174F90
MSTRGGGDGPWAGCGTHTRWTRLRTVVNWLNLSTPVGLLAARAGGASVHPIGRGVLVATGWRWRRVGVDATTVGSVVLTPRDVAWLRARPALVRHEDRHVTQYAWLLGPVLLPLYLLAAAVSWVATGDTASWNPFERTAGLGAGGSRPARTRGSRRRRSPSP